MYIARARARTHTHTHMHTRMHTHTHTNTQTHTHIQRYGADDSGGVTPGVDFARGSTRLDFAHSLYNARTPGPGEYSVELPAIGRATEFGRGPRVHPRIH